MSVFTHQANQNHQQLHFFHDAPTGLKAIIAIHDTRLGPAAGGCRMYPYASEDAALCDVLRLSEGMSYKCALAQLPLGGGKAVIIGDPSKHKTRALLLAMGRFVDSLAGQYLTSIDTGTGLDDIAVMAEQTPYVVGLDHRDDGLGPSASTARGVFRGVEASVRHRLGGRNLSGLRVAIQGVGHVGFQLACHLSQAGADLFVSDVNADALTKAQEQLGATIVSSERLLDLDVDVLAPCAMGAVITPQFVKHVKASVIAGAANNQLLSVDMAEALRKRGVLYAPDFVINAGGIIDAWCYRESDQPAEQLERLLDGIDHTLAEIYRRSDQQQQSTAAIAENLAKERMQQHHSVSDAA